MTKNIALTHKKKLIEVALPLEAINKASIREKSLRHGHPSTLHLWWARRPLAACRAILFAQLVDDPSSHPDQFPTMQAQEAERSRLFDLIEKLVTWENSTSKNVLEEARAEIRKSCGGALPPVYDPFSGGCSIPLEAQRLGLPAYGSDLNPIAVMIGKASIEIPPRFADQPPIHPLREGEQSRSGYRNAEGLAEDIRYYGERVRSKAWERIGSFYPEIDVPSSQPGNDGDGKATVIAWIWARTVPSPDPAFANVSVPLVSSFLLSAKAGKEVWLKPVVDRKAHTIAYHVRHGGTKEEISRAKEGTKAGRGANFICLMSGATIQPTYVKEEGKAGRLGATLMAIVAEGERERIYLASDRVQIQAAKQAIINEKPDTELPDEKRAFWTVSYGLTTFGSLFTNRQLVALGTFSEIVAEIRDEIERDALGAGVTDDGIPLRENGAGARAYAEAVSVYLGFAIDKCSDYWSSICTWDSSRDGIRNTFGRQAIPMTWDYAEANPFSSSSGNWMAMVNWVWKTVANFVTASSGCEIQHDAQSVTYPAGAVISTDPPYYDNIGYADLSDFFFVWLKPLLKEIYPQIFSFLSVPKTEELIAAPYRHGGKEAAADFFMQGMEQAIANMAGQIDNTYPTTIYYAFKQSEIKTEGISSTGWATFLQAVMQAGYAIVGTWPVRTEMANRMIASGTNALASSVVLVCRKRRLTAETVTRGVFLQALKRHLPRELETLQKANIAPADMPQSAIGPGIAIFSQYKKVLEADDTSMSVRTALQLINRELDDYLGGVEGDFDAETRFALTWFEQYGFQSGDYGMANNIAMAKGLSVDGVKHAGIIESRAGKVRILPRNELEEDWSPDRDDHLTIWECLHYLIRQYEAEGVSPATTYLFRQMRQHAEAVKDLAYCLYEICATKRQEPAQATSYNALIQDWGTLTESAARQNEDNISSQTSVARNGQGSLNI
ncbi:DUF1156 domain-containing protein [Saccharibacter floricola]|nr:DUF1156 domain-containing protein [Saccharibacter floricola]